MSNEWARDKDLECGIYPIKMGDYDVSIGLPHPESSSIVVGIHHRETQENLEIEIPYELASHILEHLNSDHEMMTRNYEG